MLSFDTTTPYSFEIDGKPYTLPHAKFGEAKELITAFYSAQGDDVLDVARATFEKRANKRTMTAIDTLSNKQAGQLFRAWLGGVEPGESQPSAD
jgi:hypothetical protein